MAQSHGRCVDLLLPPAAPGRTRPGPLGITAGVLCCSAASSQHAANVIAGLAMPLFLVLQLLLVVYPLLHIAELRAALPADVHGAISRLDPAGVAGPQGRQTHALSFQTHG